MAVLFVDSNGGAPSSPFVDWTDAAADIKTALADAACVAGSTVWVAHDHSVNYGADAILANNGTVAAPIKVICVNSTTGALATTALEENTVSGQDLKPFESNLIIDGITFKSADISSVGIDTTTIFRNGSFYMVINANDDLNLGVDDSSIVWENVSFSAASLTATTIDLFGGSKFKWLGGSILTAMENVFFLSGSRASTIELRGVDFSLATVSIMTVSTAVGNGVYRVKLVGCKLPNAVPILSDSSFTVPHEIIAHSCDNGNGFYYFEETYLEGQIIQATNAYLDYKYDGTNGASAKMVSNANALDGNRPLRFKLAEFWSTANPTITVETLTDNVTLQDDECWIEIEYPDETDQALRNIDRTSRQTVGWSGGSGPGTPTNLTASGETWTEDLGTPVEQKVAVTIADGDAGPHTVWGCLAKPSTTVYWDPEVTVT